MLNYNDRYVNIISIVISIIIFIFINNFIPIIKSKNQFFNFLFNSLFEKNLILIEMNSSNINQDTKEYNSNIKEKTNNSPLNNSKETIEWKVNIPKISLDAEIAEGTSKEIMDQYVGHFEETSAEDGNIGLAAHNRGYNVNYFSNLKDLQEGDEIIYKHNNYCKTYVIDKHIIIKDEDWNFLQKSEDNIITLITCVENEPEYRRCIQGIEKK